MKKKYDKPQVFFEDFQLSANIAGECNTKSSLHSNELTCGYEENGFILFVEGNSGCAYEVEGAFNRVCYHVPSGDLCIFGS